MGRLLFPCKHEGVPLQYRRMASTPHSDVYMEGMEKTKDKNGKSYQMRNIPLRSLQSELFQVERLLAHNGDSNLAYGHIQCQLEEERLSEPVGFISRMASKVGTAVCGTACTVV